MTVGDKLHRCMFADHPCGRLVGRRTDTVFIAAPSAPEHHFETALAKDVVKGAKLTPEVAVHRQLLSKEVFCAKVCGPIIESRFCIVFLNEGNPNVFYEYGMMRPLHKVVIPLLREHEACPFNVRHLDTLVYVQPRLKQMLTEAVADAVAETEPRPGTSKHRKTRQLPASPLAVQVSKLLELQEGVVEYVDGFAECAEGTMFAVKRGHDGLYLVAIVDEWRQQEVLTDTLLVCRRLDEEYAKLKQVLKVKRTKGWTNVGELQSHIDAIDHLHFVYATSNEAPDSSKDAILVRIREMKRGFPLPTVEIWSSREVEVRSAAMAGVEK